MRAEHIEGLFVGFVLAAIMAVEWMEHRSYESLDRALSSCQARMDVLNSFMQTAKDLRCGGEGPTHGIVRR